MTACVVWPDTIDLETATAVAGSKLARLAELHGIGVTVPRGFAVTVEAYRRHCAESGLAALVEESLAKVSGAAGVDDMEAASGEVRAGFATTPISEEIRGEILDAYAELSARCAEVDLAVAVRSSAIGEDSSASSFAGVFDTYLGMSGGALGATCTGHIASPRR